MTMTKSAIPVEYSATRTFAQSNNRHGYTVIALTGTTSITMGQGNAQISIPNGSQWVERDKDTNEFTVTTTGTYIVHTDDHTEA